MRVPSRGCIVGPVRRYLALLRAPHGRRLVAGGTLVRPGQAALDLVIVIGLHRATGSFAFAGAAVAAGTVASAVSTVVQGGLMDRLGIRRVLAPMAAGMAAAVAGLAAALAAGASGAVLVVLAGAAGALLPAAGAPLRTLWTALLDDPDEQSTAFAYESLAQDVGFVAGPAALGALAAAVSPVAALAVCGVLIVAGDLVVATVPAAAAPVAAPEPGAPVRPALRPLLPAAAALLAVGGALGAVDVTAPALATEHGSPAASGLLLAAFSLGSAAGGLAYGARTWRSDVQRRLLVSVAVLAALLVLPAVAPGLAVAAPALVLAGAPLAAALTTAYLLAARHAPASRRTEAFSWLSLVLNAGVALGNAAAGTIAGETAARGGFLFAAGCAAVGAVALLVVRAGRGPDRACRD